MMTVSGYYGELVVTDEFTPRWICQFASMILFCCSAYELLVGLATATAQEIDPVIGSKIQTAQVMTIISWCNYSVVYGFEVSPCRTRARGHLRGRPADRTPPARPLVRPLSRCGALAASSWDRPPAAEDRSSLGSVGRHCEAAAAVLIRIWSYYGCCHGIWRWYISLRTNL